MSNDFRNYPDLASRAIAGSVMWASDESFAEKENLITPGEAPFDPDLFGHKGKVYDGWETRRRRGAEIGGFDSAIVRLGVPGRLHGIVIDTTWFKGNYPPEAAVYAISAPQSTSGVELSELPQEAWTEIVPRTKIFGDAKNDFDVETNERFTHVRLDIFPDGGVTRLRVHGRAMPNSALLEGTIDLAASENGGVVTECSNMFYSSPNQLIGLGRASRMGDGWENARRRSGDCDFVEIKLAGESTVRRVEIDTSYFVFNAPGEAELIGITASGQQVELIPRQNMLPDTRHQYAVNSDTVIEKVLLKVYPDGGLARLRVWGELTKDAWTQLKDNNNANRKLG